MRKDAKDNSFSLPMKTGEKVFGWLYLLIHIFLLPQGLSLLEAFVLRPAGIRLESAYLNLAYYGIGFLLVLLFMFRFMRLSFHDLCDNKLNTFSGVAFGFCLYYVLSYLISVILLPLLLNGELSNPNHNAIIEQIKLDPNGVLSVGVFLAPVVEEMLFRGVAFGTLRKKHRFLAYAVSVLLFALYHVWDAFTLGGLRWSELLYMLQYLPGGIALCFCYERSKNVWGPVFLHMLINLISFRLTLG